MNGKPVERRATKKWAVSSDSDRRRYFLLTRDTGALCARFIQLARRRAAECERKMMYHSLSVVGIWACFHSHIVEGSLYFFTYRSLTIRVWKQVSWKEIFGTCSRRNEEICWDFRRSAEIYKDLLRFLCRIKEVKRDLSWKMWSIIEISQDLLPVLIKYRFYLVKTIILWFNI